MRAITVIKRNPESDTRKSVSETAGLVVDTTKDTDVQDAPATNRTGNGEGRTTKETQAKTAEKARNSGIR
jgi:hypothetical protein